MRTCDKKGCEKEVKWTLIFRLGDSSFDYCELHYAQARQVLEKWNREYESQEAWLKAVHPQKETA